MKCKREENTENGKKDSSNSMCAWFVSRAFPRGEAFFSLCLPLSPLASARSIVQAVGETEPFPSPCAARSTWKLFSAPARFCPVLVGTQTNKLSGLIKILSDVAGRARGQTMSFRRINRNADLLFPRSFLFSPFVFPSIFCFLFPLLPFFFLSSSFFFYNSSIPTNYDTHTYTAGHVARYTSVVVSRTRRFDGCFSRASLFLSPFTATQSSDVFLSLPESPSLTLFSGRRFFFSPRFFLRIFLPPCPI